MKKEEFKQKAEGAMGSSPATGIEKLWKLLEESGDGVMQLKLYKEEGDAEPYRAIVLIHGKRDVREILKFLDSRA